MPYSNRKKSGAISDSGAAISPISEYISSFKSSPKIGRQVCFHHVTGPQEAQYRETGLPLREETLEILGSCGARALYTHQAEAIDAIRQGKNVVVATATASGKSLIYNIPVLESILENPETHALYLFPLKALANDQMAAFSHMAGLAAPDSPATSAIYDGDTSHYMRSKIRKDPPNVLFTNPEMLHLSILPYHASWSSFLHGLKFVVVDEVHTYRGLLGSHMAWVFRRLRRMCRRYGSDPVFIFCSATIGNPGQLSEELSGLEVMPVTDSGAPCGRRHFLMVDPEDGGAAQMAVQLLSAALPRGLRTIVYTQSRKLTELVSLWVSERSRKFRDRISAYRAGFLPEERREIEARMADGSLLAVISTSALELGIDIGSLDLCILVGYPGTVMATWQRGGRVGRSMRESAVILIAQEDALDRYFLNHPQELVSRPAEAAVINPMNPVIAARHLVCAAAELPLAIKDDPALPPEVIPLAEELEEKGKLLRGADGSAFFTSRKYPHKDVSLRGTGNEFHIIDAETGEVVGSIDEYRAMRETHPGAIYLHRGHTWLVEDLDINGKTAAVKRKVVNYFTRVTAEKDTEIIETYRSRKIGSTTFYLGRIRVTDQVTGFEKRLVRGQRLIGHVNLDLPPMIFETEGIWFVIPEGLRFEIESQRMHFMGGIHALEHAVIGILPLFVLTDRNDLGGISFPFHPQCQSGAVFVYDGVPGGIGLARQAFDLADTLLRQVITTIKECHCENGCPSCIHSPKCGSGNRPIDKDAALFCAEALMSKKYIFTKDYAKNQIYFQGDGNRQGPCPNTQIRRGKQRHDSKVILPENFVVFDIETQRSAQEVGGWNNAHAMRVSCAALFDSSDQKIHAYLEDELPAFFERLRNAELVAGFNIKRFDYRVLAPYADFDLHALPTLDLLDLVYRRLGYRISLQGLAGATLGSRKSADGLQALKWWKQGKIEKIVKYCKKDVELTKDLLLYAAEHGYLLFFNKAGKAVRVPIEFGDLEIAGQSRGQQIS